MAVGDGLDDGQPESVARGRSGSAGRAVEAAEDTFAPGLGDAGAAVFDAQAQRAGLALQRHVDTAAGGRVLHGVAGQVAQQHAQHGALARIVVGCACGALHLQRQRRQWQTQFVRGVGHEALLRVAGVLQAAEEPVQPMHPRPDPVRQWPDLAQRCQVVGAALHELAARAPQRRPRARHGAAHGHALRHLNPQARRLQRKHAVGAAACLHRGVTQHGSVGQVGDATKQAPVTRVALAVGARRLSFLLRFRFLRLSSSTTCRSHRQLVPGSDSTGTQPGPGADF